MNRARPMLIGILALVMSLGGCMTVRPVRLPSAENPDYALRKIPPGRRIVAVTNDGVVHKFELVSMDHETLVGKEVRVKIADLRELSVERASAWRTISLVVLGGVILRVIVWKQIVSSSPSGT
jgi:hypothetical protein